MLFHGEDTYQTNYSNNSKKKEKECIEKLPWLDHLLLGVPNADAYFLPLVSTNQNIWLLYKSYAIYHK